MTEGLYADGRTFALPDGWRAVPTSVLDTALRKARVALELLPSIGPDVLTRLRTYYQPTSDPSGTMHLAAEPNEPYDLTAADLWAVSTLGVSVPAGVGVQLLTPTSTREVALRQLARLEPIASIGDLTSATLTAMWDFYNTLRRESSGRTNGNRWVMASALCARKRPSLFPMRNETMREYLLPSSSEDIQVGNFERFQVDTQSCAYIVTAPDVRRRLRELHQDLCRNDGLFVDSQTLRLLDAATWTAATYDIRVP